MQSNDIIETPPKLENKMKAKVIDLIEEANIYKNSFLPMIYYISTEDTGSNTQKLKHNNVQFTRTASHSNIVKTKNFNKILTTMIDKINQNEKINVRKCRSFSLTDIHMASGQKYVDKVNAHKNKVSSFVQNPEDYKFSSINNSKWINQVVKGNIISKADRFKSDDSNRPLSCGSVYKSVVNSFRTRLSRQCSIKSLAKSDDRVFSLAELEIKELLGEGFFGRVYKVIRKNGGEIMVMKELKEVDINAEKQFIQEIGLLKILEHKNVLKYLGVVCMNRQFNVILEFIPGGTLRKLIKDPSISLTPFIKTKLAMDISSGMAYLHSMKIAHRDLTSKNVLVRDRKNFDLVVSDFGLSRVIHRLPSFFVPQTPEKLDMVGTPFWMAPEMLSGNDYDLTVDIFSFGIVLCEILGRTSAHPDDIPRLNNFGLNEKLFREKIASIDNPIFLINIAVKSCSINPEKRSQFNAIFQSIRRRMEDMDPKNRSNYRFKYS